MQRLQLRAGEIRLTGFQSPMVHCPRLILATTDIREQSNWEIPAYGVDDEYKAPKDDLLGHQHSFGRRKPAWLM